MTNNQVRDVEEAQYSSHSAMSDQYRAAQAGGGYTSNDDFVEPSYRQQEEPRQNNKKENNKKVPARERETGKPPVMPDVKRDNFSVWKILREYYQSNRRKDDEVDNIAVTSALLGLVCWHGVLFLGLLSFLNMVIKMASTFHVLPADLKSTLNPIDLLLNGHIFTIFGTLFYYALSKFEYTFAGDLKYLWRLLINDKSMFFFVILVLGLDIGGIWLGLVSTFANKTIAYDDIFSFKITKDLIFIIIFLVASYYMAVSPEKEILKFKRYLLTAIGAIR